jgi:hypothetical protein
MGAAAPKPPLAIPPPSKLGGILANLVTGPVGVSSDRVCYKTPMGAAAPARVGGTGGRPESKMANRMASTSLKNTPRAGWKVLRFGFIFSFRVRRSPHRDEMVRGDHAPIPAATRVGA